MLDPQHECTLTFRRRAEVLLHDSDFAFTAGVSLRVVLSVFISPALIWFSEVYGDHYDNTICVAVNANESDSLQAMTEPIEGPVSQLAGDLGEIVEYRLTDSVADELGVFYRGHDWRTIRDALSGNRDRVRCCILSHDDCLVTSFPIIGITLERLVNQTLEMYSHHLGREIDWTSVAPQLAQLVRQSGGLRLRAVSPWLRRLDELRIRIPVLIENSHRRPRFKPFARIPIPAALPPRLDSLMIKMDEQWPAVPPVDGSST